MQRAIHFAVDVGNYRFASVDTNYGRHTRRDSSVNIRPCDLLVNRRCDTQVVRDFFGFGAGSSKLVVSTKAKSQSWSLSLPREILKADRAPG